jgi:hypothetical protein
MTAGTVRAYLFYLRLLHIMEGKFFQRLYAACTLLSEAALNNDLKHELWKQTVLKSQYCPLAHL